MKFLKIFLAFTLFFGLFYLVDIGKLVSVLSNLDALYVVYLFIIAFFVVWLSCLKWQLFIEASGHKVALVSLMKYYTIGYFFNIFAPSFIAGDVSRSLHLGKQLSDKKNAFISTFLERFTGLLAMTSLGMFFVVFGAEATQGVELAIYFLFFISLLMALVCFIEPLSKFFFSLLTKVIKHKKFSTLILKIDQGMAFARNDTRLFLRAMYLSFAFHMLTVLNTWVAARAIGWDADVMSLFVVVPLILLVGMIPLTPNGWGIQEGAFLYFLGRIGASQEVGLSVGLVLRAKVLIVSLFGGLLWLQHNGKLFSNNNNWRTKELG